MTLTAAVAVLTTRTHSHSSALEEGVGGLALEQIQDGDPGLLSAALTLARKTGHLPGIRDMTNHLMAIGRLP